MMRAAVLGVGQTRHRSKRTDVSMAGLCREATDRALADAGLTRVGAAAQRIMDGSARRAVAHATSGPCLQQNLVCVLEGRS